MCFINDLERPVGTYLYGRRMYQTMLYWETADAAPDQSSSAREFTSIWQAAEKIVFSKTLESAPSARTRIERNFDPDAVRQLKSGTEQDMTVGGADLAGQAIKAGLVDELQLILVPAIVGGGKRALPAASARIWNSWTCGGSHAVPFTSGTAPGRPERRRHRSRARWSVMSDATVTCSGSTSRIRAKTCPRSVSGSSR